MAIGDPSQKQATNTLPDLYRTYFRHTIFRHYFALISSPHHSFTKISITYRQEQKQHGSGPTKDKLEGYGRITRRNLKFGNTMRGQHFEVEQLKSGSSYILFSFFHIMKLWGVPL